MKGRIAKVAKNKEKEEKLHEDPMKEERKEEPAETADTEDSAEEKKPADEAAEKLEALQKQNTELSDKLLRQMAEFDNYRKRTTREKEEIGVVAKSKALTEILPVLDNFERAMQTECGDAEFRKGMADLQEFRRCTEKTGRRGDRRRRRDF